LPRQSPATTTTTQAFTVLAPRVLGLAKNSKPLEVYMQYSKIKALVLSAAMIAMTMPALGQASNKQMPDPQQQPQTQTQSTEASASSQSAEQSFQGKISESQTGYVLKDSAGVTYQLDDQKKAKDFSGQSVKVTGTLDSSTNMIHVSAISPAS
jgi:uncharacterized protein YdeI (BOF family)